MKRLHIMLASLILTVMAGQANATIIFTTDTSTDLIGTASATGDSGRILLRPSAFASFLPGLAGSNPDIFLDRSEFSVSFGTFNIGLPDNPINVFRLGDDAQAFDNFSGIFRNNVGIGGPGGRRDVFFLFTNMMDTGGDDGTFSGNFAFSTTGPIIPNPIAVPESSTFGLLCLSLVGLGFVRRRRNA